MSHYQHFCGCTEWLKKHKQNENSCILFSIVLLPLCLFWQLKLKTCCASSAADVQQVLCQDAGQLWEIVQLLQGEWKAAGAAVAAAFVSSGIQSKLYKTMLKIALLACFILDAVKTPYPHSYAIPAQNISYAIIFTLLLKL